MDIVPEPTLELGPVATSLRLEPSYLEDGALATLHIEGLANSEVLLGKECVVRLLEIDEAEDPVEVLASFKVMVVGGSGNFFFMYDERTDPPLKNKPEPMKPDDKPSCFLEFHGACFCLSHGAQEGPWRCPSLRFKFHGCGQEHQVFIVQKERDLVYELGVELSYDDEVLFHSVEQVAVLDSSRGLTLGKDDLDNKTEEQIVEANDGRGVLLPYLLPHSEYHHDVDPYVIVHGVNDGPDRMQKIINYYAQDDSKQVYIFCYDDISRFLNQTGDDLACALVGLFADHMAAGSTRPIRIVAHSMGGIVVRCAFNSLINPRWFPEEDAGDWTPRLDTSYVECFDRLHLVAIDTPWHGFCKPMFNLNVRKLMSERKRLLGMIGWFFPRESAKYDVVANSTLLQELHRLALPGNFMVNQIQAYHPKRKRLRKKPDPDARIAEAAGRLWTWLTFVDPIKGWVERSDGDIDKAVSWFGPWETPPEMHLTLLNDLRALTAEHDFPALLEWVKRARERGELNHDKFRERVAQAIPSIGGTHTEVLKNPLLFPLLDKTFGKS